MIFQGPVGNLALSALACAVLCGNNTTMLFLVVLESLLVIGILYPYFLYQVAFLTSEENFFVLPFHKRNGKERVLPPVTFSVLVPLQLLRGEEGAFANDARKFIWKKQREKSFLEEGMIFIF